MRRTEEAELTAEDLADYLGRYYCQELDSFYEVYVEDESLKLRSFFLAPMELDHREGDTFGGSGGFPFGEVEFNRTQNGAITGFTAGNGRTRGVWFQRW